MVDIDFVTPLEDRVRQVVEIELLRPRWMQRAACRGQGFDDWFAADEDGEEADAARRVCAGCRVRRECLDYAVVSRIRHGVWGGLSARERTASRQSKQATGQSWQPPPPTHEGDHHAHAPADGGPLIARASSRAAGGDPAVP